MKQQNMPYIHLSADMQLYKVLMRTKQPCGMHTPVSFIGCIGTLMDGSVLEELPSVAFKGFRHVLNGKD